MSWNPVHDVVVCFALRFYARNFSVSSGGHPEAHPSPDGPPDNFTLVSSHILVIMGSSETEEPVDGVIYGSKFKASKQ